MSPVVNGASKDVEYETAAPAEAATTEAAQAASDEARTREIEFFMVEKLTERGIRNLRSERGPGVGKPETARNGRAEHPAPS
jgi:hypothetical protein